MEQITEHKKYMSPNLRLQFISFISYVQERIWVSIWGSIGHRSVIPA